MTEKELLFKAELRALDRYTGGEPIVSFHPSLDARSTLGACSILSAWSAFLRETARRCMVASLLAEEAAEELRRAGSPEPSAALAGAREGQWATVALEEP